MFNVVIDKRDSHMSMEIPVSRAVTLLAEKEWTSLVRDSSAAKAFSAQLGVEILAVPEDAESVTPDWENRDILLVGTVPDGSELPIKWEAIIGGR
jgi:hypothetical protein